jgi:hypothetical protein
VGALALVVDEQRVTITDDRFRTTADDVSNGRRS